MITFVKARPQQVEGGGGALKVGHELVAQADGVRAEQQEQTRGEALVSASNLAAQAITLVLLSTRTAVTNQAQQGVARHVRVATLLVATCLILAFYSL